MGSRRTSNTDRRLRSASLVSLGARLCIVLGCLSAAPARGQSSEAELSQAFDAPTSLMTRELSGGQRVVVGEALIVLRANADRAAVAERLMALGMRVLGSSVPTLGIYRVGLPAIAADEVSLGLLRRVPGVRVAEWNGTVEAATSGEAPNDTWFHVQWQHTDEEHPGSGDPPATTGMGTPSAWQITTGSPDVVVAVLDSGINYKHPEFAGRLLPGYDFVNEDDDPTQVNSHGVLVTLVLAANGDNGYGTAGVDRRCKILPIQVVSAGYGIGTEFDVIQGLDFAARRGAGIINMSIFTLTASAALSKAFLVARNSGVILVTAAGNWGSNGADSNKFSGSPYTISVGATDSAGQLAWFSSAGTAVDFVAPGVDVVTTWPLSDGKDDVILVSGTSFASPMVAGVIALMKSIDPELTQDQAYAALRAGAVDGAGDPSQDAPGWDKYFGHGRINAGKALDYLCQCLDDPSFYASPQALDLAGGGSWSFRIDAGPDHAGGRYLLIGSFTGSGANATVGPTPVPLVVDAYTRYSVMHANTLPLVNSLGWLDAEGRATASLILPPMLPAVLGGLSLHHVAAVWDDADARPLHVPASLVSGPRTVQLRLPPTVLFDEDFEDGLAGWTVESEGAAAWHLAEDAECGATTRMAAFNEPGSCSFTSGAPTLSKLISPSITLNGESPFWIDFDMIRDLADESLADVWISVVDQSASNAIKTQKIPEFQISDGNTTGLVHVRVQMPQSSKFEGRTVQLRLRGSAEDSGRGVGWLVDNLVVTDQGGLPTANRR